MRCTEPAPSPRLWRALRVFAAVALAAGPACMNAMPADPPAEYPIVPHPIPTDGLVPAPEPPPEVYPTRTRRRMDVDQLDATLLRVAGTSWMEGGQNQLTALAATLGKPDFVTRTDEDLTSSPLFEKFIDDAAHKVCADLMAADAARAPALRLFFHGFAPADELTGEPLDAALAYLLLRFHGQSATGGALTVWRELYTRVLASGGPAAAYPALCIALIRHPDFTTY